MAGETPVIVRVQNGIFDIADETAKLADGRADIGAVVSFIGYCRDEGGRLAALELEHYPGMAEGEIARIANVARERWPLLGVTCIHRYGKIAPGEPIVLVLAASSHRGAAFQAAEFLMDFMKTRAPFWKREHLKDGTTGEWVEHKDTDQQAADRWA
nr:molybdenum cofactor biosynthesis protein MoaE [Faunimonas pinastri]